MKDKLETAIRDLRALLRATKKKGQDTVLEETDLTDAAGATFRGDYDQAKKLLRAIDRSRWMRTVRTSTLDVQQALELVRVEASLSAAIWSHDAREGSGWF